MLVGIGLTLVSLWYGQNHGLLPVAASAEASLVDELFNVMMTISCGLFILVQGALIVAIVRFRRRKGDLEDGVHLEGNIPLEIVWTAIPAVIVFGISIYSFDVYTEMGGLDLMNHHSTPTEAVKIAYAPDIENGDMPLLSDVGLGEPPASAGQPALEVNVSGLQYAFIFTYPDSGIVDGELHVPSGQLVRLNLQAQDVLHAFWLPEFRVKQDMIPGQETRLVLEATREGTYPVVCAELCGPYHGGMRTQLIVHSPSEYDAWVQSKVAQGKSSETLANLPGRDRTDAEYLADFVEPLNLDLDAAALAQLQSMPHAHSHMAQAGHS